jgi:hypothetical protein
MTFFSRKKIELAFQKADAMHTPWFVGEYIMESCREELTAMARYDAEYSVYNDKDDPAVVELYAIERVEIDEEEEAV